MPRSHVILPLTRTFTSISVSVSNISLNAAPSALDIQKRGMFAGTVPNLFSASPRIVVSGSTKITAVPPSIAALM